MTGTIEKRLAELGVDLPNPTPPAANYVPAVRTGNQLFISGQLPMNADGITLKGQLGAGVEIEAAREAARLCAINVLAQARSALGGDLERVVRLVKVVGFVASASSFGDQPKVVNGASDFFVDVLGDKGRHARSAVGVAALPFGAAVEVEAIFEIV
ncbi:RidA family protein [Terrihabitans sp. B22-R8]|uniref:RidA family protein n=1 Tax=Terrihabitans sp. B22-R8 TaxID=3425128 RepID=UPI00403C74C4